MDLAAAIQDVTEEAVLGLARHAKNITGEPNMCFAGGVALNCVANGKLLETGLFDGLWIQPASGRCRLRARRIA
jgi:carbamoyltransferase